MDADKDSVLTSDDLTICSTELKSPRTIAMLLNALPRSKPINKSAGAMPKSRKWSQGETGQFYRLLGVFGTDFSMMAHHSTRSKKELLVRMHLCRTSTRRNASAIPRRSSNSSTDPSSNSSASRPACEPLMICACCLYGL